jgi:uncharacterized protein YfaP (DUF2135 family)
MGNISKSLGILFVLSLLALPLTGCDEPPWEAGMTLSLKVDAPKNGTTVNTSTVTVSGRVLGTQSQDAKLTINGAAVPIKEKKYSTSVTLTEGANVINVAVTAAAGTMKEQVTVTYAPAK